MHGLVEDLSAQVLTLRDVLEMHLTEADMLECCTAAVPLEDTVTALQSYMKEQTFAEGTAVFNVGDAAEAIYIVLSGSLVSKMDFVSIHECALQAFPLCCSRANITSTAAAGCRLSLNLYISSNLDSRPFQHRRGFHV